MATWSVNDSYNRGYSLSLTVTETGTSVENNTSSISYSLVLSCTTARYVQYNTGFTVSIDGITVASQPRDWYHQTSFDTRPSSITLASGSTTVTHGQDGKKTISCSAYLDISSDYPGPGPISIPANNLVLTDIPRASSMSVPSSIRMGSSTTFSITKTVSSYNHKILYSFGSASGTAIDTTSSASPTWTPPTSLGSQIPNSASGTITFTLETYSGSTKLGSKTYTSTLSIPTDAAPTGSLSCSFDNSASSVIASWGIGVKGYSKIHWSISASPKYGATISSYSFRYSSISSSNSSGTSGIIQNAINSVQPEAKIKDSRGNEITVRASAMTVYDYAYPVINSSNAYRSNSAGAKTDDGTYVYSIVNASHTGLNGHNSLTARWRYRVTNGSWSGYTTITNGSGYLKSGYSITASYEIELSVIDSIGNVRSVSYAIDTASIDFSMSHSLNSVGLFGYPRYSNSLDVHGGINFDGAITKGGIGTLGNIPYYEASLEAPLGSAGWKKICTISPPASTQGTTVLVVLSSQYTSPNSTSTSFVVSIGYQRGTITLLSAVGSEQFDAARLIVGDGGAYGTVEVNNPINQTYNNHQRVRIYPLSPIASIETHPFQTSGGGTVRDTVYFYADKLVRWNPTTYESHGDISDTSLFRIAHNNGVLEYFGRIWATVPKISNFGDMSTYRINCAFNFNPVFTETPSMMVHVTNGGYGAFVGSINISNWTLAYYELCRPQGAEVSSANFATMIHIIGRWK